jgi:hypothetical protein
MNYPAGLLADITPAMLAVSLASREYNGHNHWHLRRRDIEWRAGE